MRRLEDQDRLLVQMNDQLASLTQWQQQQQQQQQQHLEEPIMTEEREERRRRREALMMTEEDDCVSWFRDLLYLCCHC